MIKDLLPEPHIPGRTPRPSETVFSTLKADLSSGLSAAELADSVAFQTALMAFSDRYYWEAHELFEAVWMYLPPASAERHLLKGLIQLSNAGLKGRMGQDKAVRRIRDLAGAAFAEAYRRHGAPMRLTRESVADLEARAYGENAV